MLVSVLVRYIYPLLILIILWIKHWLLCTLCTMSENVTPSVEYANITIPRGKGLGEYI